MRKEEKLSPQDKCTLEWLEVRLCHQRCLGFFKERLIYFDVKLFVHVYHTGPPSLLSLTF